MSTIKDLLKGYSIGKPQTIGIMTSMPITTDNVWQAVGNTDDLFIKSDPDYGKLIIGNKSSEINIIPHGIAYISDEPCQDRAIPKTHLVKVDKGCSARCIQDSQCGHFKSDVLREPSFLPRQLMVKAWTSGDSFSTLWGAIENFNNSLDSGRSRAYMVDYFKKYSDTLDTFAAQFEVANKQVGSFIFIENELVGVELTPNYKFWNKMWRKLLRDCYGSDCIAQTKSKEINIPTELKLNEDNIDSFEDLSREVDDVSNNYKTVLKDKIQNLVNVEIDMQETEKLEDYKVWHLTRDGYRGDVVTHGSHVIYLSLLKADDVKVRKTKTITQARWEGTELDPYKNCSNFEM